MFTKTIIITLCLTVIVCADVVQLAPFAGTTYLRTSGLPLASTYSSSVIQNVANDGHGLSYSTLQTHNPVSPVFEARLIQPVIKYNVGSLHLPIPNVGLFVQNPSYLSGLVPIQQIEPATQPGSSVQNVPILPADSLNSNDDTVTIEAN